MEPLLMMRPAARLLALHDLDRLLRAYEGAGEVGIHHRLPLLEGQFLHGHRWRADARVVEEQVEAAEGVLGLGEEGADGLRIAHVRGHHERGRAGGLAFGRGGLEEILAAPGEHHA
jgi:hypothetical protein